MHIYDRWGQLVYESTDIDKGWDGNYRGRQEPEEKYLWFICVQETATTPNNCMAGTLTLLR
jgi:gliding motility-associated-like protein